MGTNYIAPIWRMPRNANKDKLSNYSINFGGTELINCGNPTSLQFTSDFSISGWFKTSIVSNQRIVSKDDGTNRSYLVQLNGNSLRCAVFTSGTQQPNDFGSGLADGNWHHFVFTFENGIGTKIYVDNGTPNLDSFTGALDNDPADLTIGSRGDGANKFNGSISEVAIFDYALSTDQVNYLYNLNNPMAITGGEPVAYWPLGDNSNPNAPGSFPNISAGADSVFDFIPNDYIDLETNLQDILNSNQNTISIWFRSDTASSFDTLFSQGNGSSVGYRLFVSGTSLSLNRSEQSPTNDRQTVDIPLEHQKWNHLVLVTNTSNSTKLIAYLNGSSAGTYSTGTITYNNGGSQAWIGGQFGINQYWDGQIANIQIWNTDLSSAEVNTLYNNGQPLMTGTQPQETNLQAWYKLNQSANWEADTANNWQIPDAVSAYPQSFDFDSGHISLPSSSLSITGALTISAWVKTTSSTYQSILIKGTSVSAADYYFRIQDSGLIRLRLGNANYGIGTTSVKDGNWHHICVVYVPSTSVTYYVDGVQDSQTTSSIPAAITNSYTNVGIGEIQQFIGQISNVQVFDSALPATGTDSIETLYNNGVPLTTAIASDNLKLWAKLDNNEKFDGTNWSVENQKYPASYESALKFPGNFVSGTGMSFSPLTINATQANTYSAWVYPIGNTAFWTMLMGDYSGSTSRIAPISLVNSGGSAWAIRSTQRSINTTANSVKSNNISNNELGKWHHIMVVVDNLDVSFYLNGQPHGTATFTNPWTSSTFNLFNIGKFGNWVANGYMSNIAIWDSDQSTNIANIYNGGTPQNSYTVEPIALWKLDNTTTGLNDIIGGKNGTLTGDITKVNTFVSTEAGTSSGMTEQNLVNNNVSVLNGESSGMNTTNLVQSNLTRKVPFSNYSMFYDSVDVYSTFDTPFSVTATDDFSWSFWVRPIYDGITENAMLRVNATGITQTGTIRIQYSGGNWRPYFDGSSGNNFNPSTYDMPDDEWSQMVLSVTANGARYWYVNGVQVATDTGTGVATTGSWLGFSSESTTSDFEGYLSQCAYWDVALTTTELAALYNNGVPQDLRNFSVQPTQYWPMNQEYSYWDGSVWINRDIIAGNDSTTVNTAVISAFVGNAPGSQSNGVGSNFVIGYLEGNMESSDKNAYSINMADYADGVTNPANSGRSTDTP